MIMIDSHPMWPVSCSPRMQASKAEASVLAQDLLLLGIGVTEIASHQGIEMGRSRSSTLKKVHSLSLPPTLFVSLAPSSALELRGGFDLCS